MSASMLYNIQSAWATVLLTHQPHAAQSAAASLRSSIEPSSLAASLRHVDLGRSTTAHPANPSQGYSQHAHDRMAGHQTYDQGHLPSDMPDTRHTDAAAPPMSLEGPLTAALKRVFDPATSPVVRPP